ncbi:MAG: Rieske (2Fe-2S) protein [Gammaproteobacteria bacterium]|nr:Rieske (2Fe-2S) protein [Gammaproteobacteria bacterium]MBT8149817.1 Rieske (2Fe-2S) protein [Gammaproteobacteria bacterium]NND39428.1 Rieske (2Fe-2S) protein [Pseudomonadales bacterium]NNM12681.1 Rieske (2Fe-2S) protein [Pseudomonadales bacterium]
MATSAEYRLGPNAYPRGWFIVAEASELDKGAIPVSFFGQDFALYRGESGRVVMLDAYCTHMGTHIAASSSAMIVQEHNNLEGDSIRCPYHGWRFTAEGEVDDIPHIQGECPKVKGLKSYPVREVMGCVMVWWDPEGGEPLFEPPYLPEWDKSNWVQWELDHLGQLPLHGQEIIDNMADASHLGPTHGAPCEWFENEWRDHIYIQRQGGFHVLYDCMLTTTTWYTGPGLLLSKQQFGDVLTYELIANTPVAEGVSQVWHGCLSPAAGDSVTEADKATAKEIQAGALTAFSADFEIWKHKKAATRVMQMNSDGPFMKGRKWFGQFYCEKEKIAEIQQALNGTAQTSYLPLPDAKARELDAGLFD